MRALLLLTCVALAGCYDYSYGHYCDERGGLCPDGGEVDSGQGGGGGSMTTAAGGGGPGNCTAGFDCPGDVRSARSLGGSHTDNAHLITSVAVGPDGTGWFGIEANDLQLGTIDAGLGQVDTWLASSAGQVSPVSSTPVDDHLTALYWSEGWAVVGALAGSGNVVGPAVCDGGTGNCAVAFNVTPTGDFTNVQTLATNVSSMTLTSGGAQGEWFTGTCASTDTTLFTGTGQCTGGAGFAKLVSLQTSGAALASATVQLPFTFAAPAAQGALWVAGTYTDPGQTGLPQPTAGTNTFVASLYQSPSGYRLSSFAGFGANVPVTVRAYAATTSGRQAIALEVPPGVTTFDVGGCTLSGYSLSVASHVVMLDANSRCTKFWTLPVLVHVSALTWRTLAGSPELFVGGSFEDQAPFGSATQASGDADAFIAWAATSRPPVVSTLSVGGATSTVRAIGFGSTGGWAALEVHGPGAFINLTAGGQQFGLSSIDPTLQTSFFAVHLR